MPDDPKTLCPHHPMLNQSHSHFLLGLLPGLAILTLSAQAGEKNPIGSAAPADSPSLQPVWRDLADTKFYVLPAGEVDVRLRGNFAWFPEDPAEQAFLPEVSIGLPGRFQLTLQDEAVHTKADGLNQAAFFTELRWALAPWGHIPSNPTFGLGYEAVKGNQDVLKASLYLGEQFDEKWLWAGSFTYQKRLGGDRELELIGKMGLHYILIQDSLTIGAEAKFEAASNNEPGNKTVTEFLIGPALMWRISERTVYSFPG